MKEESEKVNTRCQAPPSVKRVFKEYYRFKQWLIRGMNNSYARRCTNVRVVHDFGDAATVKIDDRQPEGGRVAVVARHASCFRCLKAKVNSVQSMFRNCSEWLLNYRLPCRTLSCPRGTRRSPSRGGSCRSPFRMVSSAPCAAHLFQNERNRQ